MAKLLVFICCFCLTLQLFPTAHQYPFIISCVTLKLHKRGQSRITLVLSLYTAQPNRILLQDQNMSSGVLITSSIYKNIFIIISLRGNISVYSQVSMQIPNGFWRSLHTKRMWCLKFAFCKLPVKIYLHTHMKAKLNSTLLIKQKTSLFCPR